MGRRILRTLAANNDAKKRSAARQENARIGSSELPRWNPSNVACGSDRDVARDVSGASFTSNDA